MRSTKAAGAPVTVRVSYVLRNEACRDAFLDLIDELEARTVDVLRMAGANAEGYSVTESPLRRGWFTEVFQFGTRPEREKFDDLYYQDRPTAAIQALLEETIDAARCDYVMTEGAA
jgi:hypothetical protein